MLIAKNYVRIGARVYVGGEVIEESVSDKTREWLLKAGAVIETAPLPPGDGIQEEPEEPAGQEDAVLEETEIDAPEIDAMAGIIGDDEPPKKAARGRRKGGSK